MPVIGNFLNNQQTPLGAAFKNLIGTLAAAPTDVQLQAQADAANLSHRKLLGQEGVAESLRHGFPQGTPPSVGTGAPAVSPITPNAPAYVPQNGSVAPTSIAGKFAQLAPQGAAPQPPMAAPPMAAPPQHDIVEGPSPIASAFMAGQPQAQSPQPAQAKPQMDFGELARNAVYADMKPEDLGGYVLFGDANTYGARDPRTTNATVGAGKPYSSTAENFDINQSNDLTKAQNTNATSVANNAATNATSRANNHDNISKDYGIERMKEAHDSAQADAGTGNWTPAAVDYAAEVYRRTGQMPSVGMGKSAGNVRGLIMNRSAEMDHAEGKTPGDTVAGFAEYQGAKAGERTLGNREATAGMAVNELKNLIPGAKEMFAKVNRTGLLPVDSLLEAYQHGTNDPDLAAAAVRFNDIVTSHAKAISPQGVLTDAGREQSIKLLRTAQGQAAVNSTLDQMMVGAERARQSPGQTRHDLHESIAGRDGATLQFPGTPAAGGSDIDALVNHYKSKK